MQPIVAVLTLPPPLAAVLKESSEAEVAFAANASPPRVPRVEGCSFSEDGTVRLTREGLREIFKDLGDQGGQILKAAGERLPSADFTITFFRFAQLRRLLAPFLAL